MQERTNREVKRRARVVQSFPSEEALIRLAGAVCCEASGDWSSADTWTRPRSRGYGRGRRRLRPTPRKSRSRGRGRVVALSGFDEGALAA